MEENYLEADLEKRLILAGIRELDEHGEHDFSLRRVAAHSGVSCAAPYKHFKNRDDLIVKIIEYVNSKWDLLFTEICRIYRDAPPMGLILESSAAAVRFFLANANYRTVIFSSLSDTNEAKCAARKHILSKLDELVFPYCEVNRIQDAEERAFAIHAMIYGTVVMAGGGELSDIDRAVSQMRAQIQTILS